VFCNVARLDMEQFYAYMGLMWGLYSNENEYGLLHHYMHNCARRRLGYTATLPTPQLGHTGMHTTFCPCKKDKWADLSHANFDCKALIFRTDFKYKISFNPKPGGYINLRCLAARSHI
jgi:hypothetical protein